LGDDAGVEALTRAHSTIIREARAHVAAGRDPNADALAARIRAATQRERDAGADSGEIDRAERRALKQLERIAAVYRARAALRREPATPRGTPSPGPRRPALRARATITGNMEVRAAEAADAVALRWDAAPSVVSWEVRVSERPGARPQYVVRETRELPGDATEAEVELGERPLRVHLLGRGRDGRLLRRAIVSSLTRENWRDRWERRASAS
jgi:hypothetical protein